MLSKVPGLETWNMRDYRQSEEPIYSRLFLQAFATASSQSGLAQVIVHDRQWTWLILIGCQGISGVSRRNAPPERRFPSSRYQSAAAAFFFFNGCGAESWVLPFLL